MNTHNPKPQLPSVFTPRQQALIEQIFSTKISELIASGGLVCSHCSSSNSSSSSSSNSNSSSSSQLPWLPADSKVSVPTTPLQEQATKLQQIRDNRSDIGLKAFDPSTNSIAANLSTSAILFDKLASVDNRLTHLEYRFNKFKSSMVQSNSFHPESKNVDSTHLLGDMHAHFKTAMSKLQLALQQTTYNQQKLESTECTKSEVQRSSDISSNVGLEQSDVNNLTGLQSVAVDRHELLSTLVLNIGHEHNELAEFVRQLSECTASADDVVELKAVVECMARVTGVSEHKAEQLIREFIGRESVELEHLKHEQRLADDKIRELLLAKDQMAEMYDSPYQNQIPYLNLVTKTMRSECKRYKRDLNAISKRLSECVNAKVAQAIQQSLVDKHQQNNKEQDGLPSTENLRSSLPSVSTHPSSKLSTEVLQPVADDGRTLADAAAAVAALEDKPPRPRNPNLVQVINYLIVGHESAQAQRLVQAFVKNMSGKTVTSAENNTSVDEVVAVRSGSVHKLYLANCTEANKLMLINYCDVIVICFSVVDKASYQDVRNVWLKQIKQVFPDKPYLLVGTQVDQRKKYDIKNFQVNYEQGFFLSETIGAVAYLECSDFEVDGVVTMFMYALQHAIDKKKRVRIKNN